MRPVGVAAGKSLNDVTGNPIMVRLLSLLFFIVFVGILSWYITRQLKEIWAALHENGTVNYAKPVLLGIASLLFILAAIQSFFEQPEDLPSHLLLVVTTLLLSFALAINKASVTELLAESKRLLWKIKIAIANQLIRFGKGQ